MLFSLLFVLTLPLTVSSQASQWIDTFQKDLCRDRWSQMDWQSILRPCRFNTEYGKNKHEEKKRSSQKWSHTTGLHFQKTGEFSKITLQTRTADGRLKEIGGDTWRLFIRGADRITPFISDLNNGVYEAKFIALQPGFYKAELVLESSLCEAFKDPPQDWLKRDALTIISDEKNDKLVWEPLRGGNISFKIEESPHEVVHSLRQNFRRWRNSCGPQYKCDMLWKGFGRWVNSTWVPYIDDDLDREEEEDELVDRCLKTKEGVLKMTGDDLTKSLSYTSYNGTLCNEVFQRCESESPGEQPDGSSFEKRNIDNTNTQKLFTTKPYLHALKELLKKDYMNEKSGLLLNYGHPFVQNMGFKQWRSFIDRVARIVKEKYKGKALWRTMSSQWRDAIAPVDHFKNHQRIKLFNAYATSALCNAGVPVLDVFQMTESAPVDDKTAVVKNIERIVTNYFRQHPAKPCTKKKSHKKKKSHVNNNSKTLNNGIASSKVLNGTIVNNNNQTISRSSARNETNNKESEATISTINAL